MLYNYALAMANKPSLASFSKKDRRRLGCALRIRRSLLNDKLSYIRQSGLVLRRQLSMVMHQQVHAKQQR